MTYKEVLQAAKGQMGLCHVCPVCNGRACGGTMPGPGAKGSGTVAIRNFNAWQNVRLNMDTIHENFEPDTALELFGRTFKYPFFAGPVGAMTLHYGKKYNDMQYNELLVSGCAAAGIAAFTGDGTNPLVMQGAVKAIAASGGVGIPTVKPWDMRRWRRNWRWRVNPGALRWRWTSTRQGCRFCSTLTRLRAARPSTSCTRWRKARAYRSF